MDKKMIISFFVDLGVDALQIVQESGSTITVSVKMTRQQYEQVVAIHLEPGYVPQGKEDWRGELRGLQKVGERGQSSQTGGGLYLYEILIFKF